MSKKKRLPLQTWSQYENSKEGLPDSEYNKRKANSAERWNKLHPKKDAFLSRLPGCCGINQ